MTAALIALAGLLFATFPGLLWVFFLLIVGAVLGWAGRKYVWKKPALRVQAEAIEGLVKDFGDRAPDKVAQYIDELKRK